MDTWCLPAPSRDLNISGNTMEFSTDYPPIAEFPSINLQYCDAVTIKNNTAKGFDRPAIIANSADVTNLEIGRNEGFETE